MKKVVLNPPQAAIVEVKNVGPHRYYGMTYYGGKAFMTAKEYVESEGGNAAFVWLCCEAVTRNNKVHSEGLNGHGHSSVKDAISYVLERHSNCEIFEFETSLELFQWLAKP